MNRCLMLVLALLCLSLPGFAAATEAACRAAQLKAAANFCGQALACESRYVRQSAQDPTGSGRDACLGAAAEGLGAAHDQAVNQETTGGGQCRLNVPGRTVGARWRGHIAGPDGLIPFMLRGWEAGNAVGDKLYASMFQAAAAGCKTLLDAHAAHAQRPNARKLAVKLKRTSAMVARKLDQARKTAARKSYAYRGERGRAITAAVGRYAEILVAEASGRVPIPPDPKPDDPRPDPPDPPPDDPQPNPLPGGGNTGGGGNGGGGNDGGGDGAGLNRGLQGKLYFGSANVVVELDLMTGVVRTLRDADSRSPGASRDGSEVAALVDIRGEYYSKDLVIFGLNGVTLASYRIPCDYCGGPIKFSPDGGLLIYRSDTLYLARATVLRRDNGATVVNYTDSDKELNSYAWLPDGRLLFAEGNQLIISDGTLRNLSVFATLPDPVSSLEVSPDGSRIAFAMSKHIWTMNGDGSGLKQATESSGEEARPGFSPDGRSMIVGEERCLYTCAWIIWVMPADGERVWIGEERLTAAFQIRELEEDGRVFPSLSFSNISWR